LSKLSQEWGKIAEYRCDGCWHTFEDYPGPVDCPHCDSHCITWTNYDEHEWLEGPVNETVKMALATVDDALEKLGIDPERLPKKDPLILNAYKEEALIEARIWLFRALGRAPEPEEDETHSRPKNKKKRKDKKRKKRRK
jgi:hypothetical protein